MKDGFRVWTWNLIVFVRENGLDSARLGLAAGRKVGNAVARNRWKRLIREVFRNSLKPSLAGFDMVVAVKAVAGFDRSRGDKTVAVRGKKSVRREIPSFSVLEGELNDALRRIDRKMAGKDSGHAADGPNKGV